MTDRVYNVLFLCTGNSARSILAEVLIDRWGRGQFKGYSAGSFPKGAVHPLTFELLERLRLPTGGLRSKSWDEFARPDAPVLDFVFTVCDQAVKLFTALPIDKLDRLALKRRADQIGRSIEHEKT
ncbi:MAG: hypothetical protein AUG92_00350 [Alphaproteobacteria bacterium 13_1_20CM_4_65_11]|nr:MAG: hypothetical protein AUG92_00350 [Alphaproteobacteria bacterium 13_1_20CM_4_65_11]